MVLASQLTLEEGISPLAREFSGHTVIGCDEQLLETEDSLLISSEASVSYYDCVCIIVDCSITTTIYTVGTSLKNSTL